MKEGKKEDKGYLQAISEMGESMREQALFDESWHKFLSFLFSKGRVSGGRWWVGQTTYKQAVDERAAKIGRGSL